MTEARSIPKAAVIALLASSLGQEKAEEVVSSVARSLGIPGTAWSGREVRAIAEELAKAEGLVGVVARFALSRGDVDRIMGRGEESGTSLEEVPPSSVRHAQRAAALAAHANHASRSGHPDHDHGGHAGHGHVDLVGLLAPALGVEKARDVTDVAAAAVGLDARHLSQEQALLVLDELAKNEGIVGVVARFAKARFLLTVP